MTTTKQRPVARLIYRAVTGTDEAGRDIFEKQGTEIAAIWCTKSARCDRLRFKGVLPQDLTKGDFLIVPTGFAKTGTEGGQP